MHLTESPRELLAGSPACAPATAVMSEGIIGLIRRLHSIPSWASTINQHMCNSLETLNLWLGEVVDKHKQILDINSGAGSSGGGIGSGICSSICGMGSVPSGDSVGGADVGVRNDGGGGVKIEKEKTKGCEEDKDRSACKDEQKKVSAGADGKSSVLTTATDNEDVDSKDGGLGE